MGNSILDLLRNTFSEMWGQVVQHVPSFLAAVAVMIIGAFIASALKKIIETISKRMGINSALQSAGLGELLKRADLNFEVGTIVGTLVKWFVLLVFFIVALDIMGLNQVNIFLREEVLNYVPRVIVAVLILIVATIAANFVKQAVVSFAKVANLRNAEMFGKVSYGAILTIAVLAALNELRVASELIQPLFYGATFAIALALGLSFGLGGREAASRAIDSIIKR